MKLVCPACGAGCAAEAWANDAEARQALRLVSELPEAVGRRALGYLALFRPPAGRGLRWQTALRHLSELDRLVRAPHVAWEGRPARPNAPRFWGQAMERLIERPPQRLPLKNHNYLRACCYDVADEADKAAEQARSQKSATALRAEAETTPALDIEAMRRVREAKMNKRRPAGGTDGPTGQTGG